MYRYSALLARLKFLLQIDTRHPVDLRAQFTTPAGELIDRNEESNASPSEDVAAAKDRSVLVVMSSTVQLLAFTMRSCTDKDEAKYLGSSWRRLSSFMTLVDVYVSSSKSNEHQCQCTSPACQTARCSCVKRGAWCTSGCSCRSRDTVTLCRNRAPVAAVVARVVGESAAGSSRGGGHCCPEAYPPTQPLGAGVGLH